MQHSNFQVSYQGSTDYHTLQDRHSFVESILFFQKNVVRYMPISINIPKDLFYFQCKKTISEKIISLKFWHLF
jgi:hypothetical protein